MPTSPLHAEALRLRDLIHEAELPVYDQPAQLGREPDSSYCLYQSSDDASLRLYLRAVHGGVQVSFTALFLPEEHRPPAMLNPGDGDLMPVWRWLCEQHRLSVHLGFLKGALAQAGFPCALPLLDQVADQRRTTADRVEAIRAWEDAQKGNKKEALAKLLRDTADKVEAHRGGTVVHEAEDLSGDDGMFVGCRVLISGYLGG